jgi:hypothetical protein
MKRRSRMLQAVTVAGVLLATAATLWANGQEFFPAGNGPVDLVYFGRIKDARTGRVVTEYPYVTIRDNTTGVIIPFTGDAPGHFRSPDIGVAIKEISGEAVDPTRIEIDVTVPGYKKIKLAKAPRKAKGTIEIDFRVEPNDTPAVPGGTPGENTRGIPASAGQVAGDGAQGMVWMVLLGLVALAVIATVARTVGRHQTTSH